MDTTKYPPEQLRADADTLDRMGQHERARCYRAHAAALDALADAQDQIRRLEKLRIKYGPICLVCGAAEPCEKASDACTFDPAPRELWDALKVAREALIDLSEYWNGTTNERAMEDACEHTITTARAALAAMGENNG